MTKKAIDWLFFPESRKNSTYRLTKFLDYQLRLQSNHRTRQKFIFSLSMILIVASLYMKRLRTLRIMRRPILSASRNTNYDLDVLFTETHVSTKSNEILKQLENNSNKMSLTYALTKNQEDALKDQNLRNDADSSPEISKITQHEKHDDRPTNDSTAAITIFPFRTSMLR